MNIKKALLVVCGVIVLGFLVVYFSGYDEGETKPVKEYKREKPLFKPIEKTNPPPKPEVNKESEIEAQKIKSLAEQLINKWNSAAQEMRPQGYIYGIEWSSFTMWVKFYGFDRMQCRVIALNIHHEFKNKADKEFYVHMMERRGKDYKEILVYNGRRFY